MIKQLTQTGGVHRLAIILSIAAGLLLASCGTTRVNYDTLYFHTGADTVEAQQKETLIQPNDVLNILVFSKTANQEQAAVFNQANAVNGTVTGYKVGSAGQIQVPMLGGVKAAGLTKLQLQDELEQKLNPYVKNPSVLVRFLEFNVSVLGEVKAPGTKRFIGDRVTILDALSAAGDLTDYGQRSDVVVVRETENKRIYHTVDLRSKNLFQSPVYVLQPDDVVYVRPNQNKLKTLSVDPERQRKTGLLLSITSIGVAVATLVVTLLRN